MNPSLGLPASGECSGELRKPFYSLDYQFITKNIKADTNQQPDEAIHMTKSWTKELCPQAVWGPIGGIWKSSSSPTWKLEKTLGFLCRSAGGNDWLDHWPLVPGSESLPSSLSRGHELEVPSSMVSFFCTQPLSIHVSKSHSLTKPVCRWKGE